MEPHRQNLDSLVDIVSNNLGILVIIAAFMALIGITQPLFENEVEQQSEAPEILKIPWSHETTRTPLLFVIKENKILHLDLKQFYVDLANYEQPMRPQSIDFEQPNARIKFFPVTSHMYCLEFFPDFSQGENWDSAQEAASNWQKVRNQYTPHRFYYYFWVYGDSFQTFNIVRNHLWDSHVEVGWEPITPKDQLDYCTGFDRQGGLRPQ